jgi:hypothetical protein
MLHGSHYRRDRSNEWQMDPLSDILSLLKPRNYLTGGLDAGGGWCLQFGSYEGIKVNAVVSGRCWLSVDGGGDPVQLEAGDCFLLPKGRPVRLASDLTLPPINAMTIFPPSRRGSVRSVTAAAISFSSVAASPWPVLMPKSC